MPSFRGSEENISQPVQEDVFVTPKDLNMQIKLEKMTRERPYSTQDVWLIERFVA